MTRERKWLIGIGAGLLLLVVLVRAFDWNLARPYIARQVTSSTGRSFEIKGDLEVHLSLWPRITANDIAELAGTISWDVLASLQSRSPRIFHRGGLVERIG